MRHLTEGQAVKVLRRGGAVEQLLSADSTEVEWLRLSGRLPGVALVRHRVRDVGSVDVMDVYGFPPCDPDEDHGEGRMIATFEDAAEAVAAGRTHGAQSDRWVNEGVLQDEYAEAADR